MRLATENVTVTITADAMEQYALATRLLARADQWAAEPYVAALESDEWSREADRREKLVARMRSSLHGEFALMMASHTTHDGDKKLVLSNGTLSWLWTYPDSGYTGGLVFTQVEGDDETPIGYWSINT